jgi:hypothetical protein
MHEFGCTIFPNLGAFHRSTQEVGLYTIFKDIKMTTFRISGICSRNEKNTFWKFVRPAFGIQHYTSW